MRSILLTGLVLLLVVTACEIPDRRESLVVEETMEQSDNPVTARATFSDGQEAGLSGELLFSEHEQSIQIRAHIAGLQPDSTYALYLLEGNDCSSSAAGEASARLGTLRLTGESRGYYDRVDGMLDLEGSASIIGRAIALYAAPSTNAESPGPATGDALACSIIQKDSAPGSHFSDEEDAAEAAQEETNGGS